MAALVVVGLNHRTTPLDLRERLAIEPERWQMVWSTPSVLLSTCNRVEIYAWADAHPAHLVRRLGRALSRASGVAFAELAPCLFEYVGPRAVLHLVRVAAGLDSLVLGDEQIRGQVRDACGHRAAGSSPLPSPLDGIFTRALEAGKKIHCTSLLGRHPSVAEAAIRVANSRLPDNEVRSRRALVLGAGAMAAAAARALLATRWHVTLVNRTAEHAATLAQSLGGRVDSESLDRLADLLSEADLLVGATASRQPVLHFDTVRRALLKDTRSLLILDIALPRDVDPSVRRLERVKLVDLTDLEQMCPVEVGTRKEEIARAETLAAAEAERIQGWLRMRTAVPAIIDLRKQGEQIRTLELQRAERRLSNLTPDEREAVEAVTGAIVNKLLHGPTVLLRESAEGFSVRRLRAMVQEVLRLDSARHSRWDRQV